jgi:hypothetical protein
MARWSSAGPPSHHASGRGRTPAALKPTFSSFTVYSIIFASRFDDDGQVGFVVVDPVGQMVQVVDEHVRRVASPIHLRERPTDRFLHVVPGVGDHRQLALKRLRITLGEAVELATERIHRISPSRTTTPNFFRLPSRRPSPCRRAPQPSARSIFFAAAMSVTSVRSSAIRCSHRDSHERGEGIGRIIVRIARGLLDRREESIELPRTWSKFAPTFVTADSTRPHAASA